MLSRLRYVGRAFMQIAPKQTVGISHPFCRTFLTAQTKMVRFSKISTRSFSAYPEHKVHNLPNLSPTMTKGTITKWYKKEGESFSAGDVLCDVETDKATVGFEMVDDGVLAKIFMPEGTKDIPLGTPVAITVNEVGDVAAFKDYKAEAAPKPAVSAPAPEAPKPAAPKEEPKPQAAAPTPAPTPVPTPVAPKPEPKTPQAVPGMPEFEDIELTSYKRVTAERLTEAKQTVPHFYVSVDCEMDEIMKLRSFLNKYSKSKISINDMLIKACALACIKVPPSNSSWMGAIIRKYKDVDMSVAVQTPKGLITPIVPRANLKGLEEIATITKGLIVKAKDGSLKPEEFIGGTFTISNAGMYGISQLIPVVNPPQACILGVGGVEKEILFSADKEWRIASKMRVCLSCDHRVVDGGVASEWTQEFKKLIENPMLMLL